MNHEHNSDSANNLIRGASTSKLAALRSRISEPLIVRGWLSTHRRCLDSAHTPALVESCLRSFPDVIEVIETIISFVYLLIYLFLFINLFIYT